VADETQTRTLGGLLRHARAVLQASGHDEAALDARLLVEHFTGATRADTILDPGRLVSAAQVLAVEAALQRRLAAVPVYRIIGERDFYGLRLRLSPATLEPRPDTEALVDLILPSVRAAADRHGACRVLDLGTGTGAIALALLREEPRATAVATDISLDALATAAANADINALSDRFQPLVSDWFDAVEGRFDIIVSNPPYIASKDIAMLKREVRENDPRTALDGGPDGLDAYRSIAAGAPEYLGSDGAIAVEIGYDQAETVPAVFAARNFALVQTASDLAGVVRALMFEPIGR